MAKIPNTTRRGARYSFRRRLSLPDGSTVLLGLPLATADPATARSRASALSARFEAIKAGLRRSEGWRVSLNASQMTAVFKSELEAELGRAMAEIFTAENVDAAVLDSRLHHEAWAVTQAPHQPVELTPADEYCLKRHCQTNLARRAHPRGLPSLSTPCQIRLTVPSWDKPLTVPIATVAGERDAAVAAVGEVQPFQRVERHN
jgi:hypothetical protein